MNITHVISFILIATIYLSLDAFEVLRSSIKHHKTFLFNSKQRAKSSVAALCTKKKMILHEAVNKACKEEILRTPLYRAQSKEIAQLLIDHGDEVNAQNSVGDTPLHFADATSIPVLLACGADISIKNKESEHIWLDSSRNDHVTNRNMQKINNVVIKYNQQQSFKIDFQIDRGYTDICLVCDGMTPLMKSFFKKDTNKFKSFIDHADPKKLKQELNPIKVIIEAYKLYHPDLFVPNLKNIERLSIDHLIKEFEEKTQ